MKEMKVERKKLNVEKRKLKINYKIFKYLLYIIMLILIFIISPKLTYCIKNIISWINELDDELINRFIAISITVLLMFIINKNKKKGVKSGGKINNGTGSDET